MATGLSDMGIGVKLEDDRISITGGTFNPAVINPMGDHRIAMAFSIAGAIAGDITIKDAECVSKTYPRYWEDFNKLGGKAVTHGK
jgi:3-phosphoshikimate 1-carboxyvinyltransferase